MQLLEKIKPRYLAIVLAVLVVLAIVLLAVSGEKEPETPQAAPEPVSSLKTNPYTAEDFERSPEGYIHCLAEDSSLGIDVSGYQGEIDWAQVKTAGVEFVFIRVGYRGNTEGGLYPDALAQDYYNGAKAAGLKVGAYFFSQAITPAEAQEEAWFVLDQVKNWELDLPVVYDWEWVSSDARTANMQSQLLTHCTKIFCETVENAGLESMIYFNYSQGTDLLDLQLLSEYGFWLALYGDYPDFPFQVDCWQYSCTGTVPGITGDVDLNLYLKTNSTAG